MCNAKFYSHLLEFSFLDKSDKEVAQHIDGGNRLVSQRVVLGNNNVSVKKKNVENLIESKLCLKYKLI